jgi:hypothetical protein
MRANFMAANRGARSMIRSFLEDLPTLVAITFSGWVFYLLLSLLGGQA